MAEIKIERKQRSLLPWILGLILLVALALWGASVLRERDEVDPEGRGAAAADAWRDNTPPHLRQYAAHGGLAALPVEAKA